MRISTAGRKPVLSSGLFPQPTRSFQTEPPKHSTERSSPLAGRADSTKGSPVTSLLAVKLNGNGTGGSGIEVDRKPLVAFLLTVVLAR